MELLSEGGLAKNPKMRHFTGLCFIFPMHYFLAPDGFGVYS